MQECKKRLHLSRVAGRFSALFFIFTALCIFDALQTMIRHEFNQIDIVAGEHVYITGNMPQGKTSIDDIVIRIEGYDALEFELTEAFSGFWFGGKMWRAKIYAPVALINTRATLIVEDLWEEQDSAGNTVFRQNPTLIYPIYIWKDYAAKNATATSFFIRLTSIHPFFLGVCGVAFAISFAFFQWYIFRKADKILIAKGIYFIHGIKKDGQNTRVLFVFPQNTALVEKTPVVLMDNKLNRQNTGEVIELNKGNGVAGVLEKTPPPKYGWFLCSLETFNKLFL